MADIANVPDSPSSVEAALISYPYPAVYQPSGVDRDCDPSAGRYHPYARQQKQRPPRRSWQHSLEKALFSPLELTTLGVSQRRPIYIASLEAHIDRLHMQLMGLGADFFPVPLKDLDALKGLNTKTCKGMVSGLQHDIWQAHERLLELQRTNEELEAVVYAPCDE